MNAWVNVCSCLLTCQEPVEHPSLDLRRTTFTPMQIIQQMNRDLPFPRRLGSELPPGSPSRPTTILPAWGQGWNRVKGARSTRMHVAVRQSGAFRVRQTVIWGIPRTTYPSNNNYCGQGMTVRASRHRLSGCIWPTNRAAVQRGTSRSGTYVLEN